MKRTLLWVLCASTLLITSSSLSAATGSSQQQRTVSIDDMVLLVSSGISDETILAFLKDRELDFLLSREIRLLLAQSGITNTVMQYLNDQETALNPPLPTGVALTGYNSMNYPSYYRSGRISGSLFPFAWYSHHYFGSHSSASHPYTPVYSTSPGIHQESGVSHRLEDATHSLTHLGEHQNSLTDVIHHSSLREHSAPHNPHYPRRYSAGHIGGHAQNFRHTIGHSVGHTSRHAVGHTGSRHSGGHSRH